MPTTDWLIGSHPAVPECTMTVDAGASPEVITIDAGAYYLWDDDSQWDLTDVLETQLNTHSNLGDVRVWLGRNRLVNMDSSTAFSITWTGDTTVRNMLGFTGNLSSSTTHEANAMSALFWSPGKEGSPDARLGVSGHLVYDTQMTMSGTGVVSTVQHNSYRQNGYTWRNVANGRVHSTSESAGEWVTFFDQVVRRGRKFKLLRNVNEDTTDSSAATMTGDFLGPYVVRGERSPWVNDPRRELQFVESRNRVSVKMNTVPEYT